MRVQPEGFSMHVFVSGATGVIGRRVVPLLKENGHTVTVATRRPPDTDVRRMAINCVQADLYDLSGLKRLVAGHDAIINLATSMPSPAWKMAFRAAWRANDRLRTQGVANLVEAALARGVRCFVQESFAFAYPDQGDRWIGEELGLVPSAYNRTLLDCERALAGFTAAGGRGVVLRFGAFYGPDASQLCDMIDWLKRGIAILPGRPEAYFSSVSHDDAAAAVVAALLAEAGVYNVADDQPLPRRLYCSSLAQALGLRAPRFLPPWTRPLFGSVGEAMARSVRLSNRKLKQATEWRPRHPSVVEAWAEVIRQMSL
jgi:nucleoside-diphosphate-sugar epimerase